MEAVQRTAWRVFHVEIMGQKLADAVLRISITDERLL